MGSHALLVRLFSLGREAAVVCRKPPVAATHRCRCRPHPLQACAVVACCLLSAQAGGDDGGCNAPDCWMEGDKCRCHPRPVPVPIPQRRRLVGAPPAAPTPKLGWRKGVVSITRVVGCAGEQPAGRLPAGRVAGRRLQGAAGASRRHSRPAPPAPCSADEDEGTPCLIAEEVRDAVHNKVGWWPAATAGPGSAALALTASPAGYPPPRQRPPAHPPCRWSMRPS